MLLQTATATTVPCSYYCCCFKTLNSNPNQNQNPTCLFPKTPILQNLDTNKFYYYYLSAKANRGSFFQSGNSSGIKFNKKITSPRATLLESPVIWAGRVFVFYALLKVGLAGSSSNPFVSSDLGTGSDDFGFSEFLSRFRPNPGDKEANERRKLVRKWHRTTKGTLRRNYRVPSKSVGRNLLKAVASLLSDDDHFRDATSHKGCQIRRQNAHGESVCCNNVRALFDELPTPHLIVEITPFPAGPLTEIDFAKAEKLEKVLRSGPSV